MAHVPRKRFGQNFLESETVIRQIVGAIAPARNDRVVEIGPGLGALTGPMLEKVGRLDVIELDRDLAAALADRLGNPPNLVVHQADALTFDFASLAGPQNDRPLRVIGNLPYNISTPLLFHLLDQADAIADMHFMLQKEVVDRLTAGPGSKAWSRLGVMTAARAETTALFTVPPGAFRPPPKVESAFVRIVPRSLSGQDRARFPALEHVVRQAFGQRRKTLRNTLRNVLDADEMAHAGIDPGRRAETLSLEEFVRLADLITPRGVVS
ncbi:MAG: 16S rRNA (adenine(1518)-N(6)/adenine(1519)-N(6))-dimethyltransferase RsmA [Wenzhouxiangellaceae bacterium]|nr:16S rRNA (adenine(1518)-N(6)/adenine(1519)-N(6))-dimethyltransferase RsmA [Wenzhouxiangellaceae bacterium]